MSEIKDVADTKFDELLEHIALGELDIVESRANGHDVSEELLGIGSAPADDTPSTSTHNGRRGELCSGMNLGSSPSLYYWTPAYPIIVDAYTCVSYSKVVQRLELFKEVR